MHRGGAVDTQPDEKTVVEEESRPFVVDQGSIGLDGVFDDLARSRESTGKRNRLGKEVDPDQSRFPALPGDRDRSIGLALEKLADVGLERVAAHAKTSIRVERILGQVEAVGAVEIAHGSNWFGQDVKAESLRWHASILVGLSPLFPCRMASSGRGPATMVR